MVFAGVDPILQPIPVRPGSHYHMGGVDTDLDGKTVLEASMRRGMCLRLRPRSEPPGRERAHGDVTYGKRAGRAAAEWALTQHRRGPAGVSPGGRGAGLAGAARPHRR